jgi:transcriptional regulator with XRE-family HTH domain
MKFSEMLKDARKKFNYSQKSLADRLGLKPPTISKYENGIAFPSPEVLRGLCGLFRWDTTKVFKMVYNEKIPETAKPFVSDFLSTQNETAGSPAEEVEGHFALQEFLQDPQMPNPTDAELEVLMGVKIKGREPTKWFYKSLLDDLRNEGLVRKKGVVGKALIPQ